MKHVTIERIEPLSDAKFITPVRIKYMQNGRKKSWEAVRAHDSVAVLLYHREKEAFLLVRQLRVPTLLNGEEDGYTYELCAGIVDKNLPLVEIAAEEIFEECGYAVESKQIRRVTSYYTSVGFSGAKQTMYYAEIDESMKKGAGGGIEEEEIELFFLPLKSAKAFMFDESYKKTPGLMMAFYWFFDTFGLCGE